MAIIKCKMCGGNIELAADKTFGTCEFCGSTMTFPKVDDDQRAAAFNRGNHFRRIGEFDKALAVYERIVREDDTDAEAHWCCALCRFGIEYVEDPATYEYLPTCHRASFDSFLEDVDYLAAVEHSEGITKRQYQKDGAKIAEVQRGILATSQNEEPFDVFICYKESDENGERTRDSLMAQDVYYQLTDQGYRVFFARITLEDVVGKQYEPYIFAALNSAKVMIAIGTKPEYMNAVWVKNEWSRFLAMMKKDRRKILLPCYKDMDPYDMPEQLSVLQSYDMSKIGFIQDLIRGIKKIAEADTPKTTVVKETVISGGNANTAPLLKRAFMFLEDKEWNSADEYCEKVLDIDPECAEAYLGKLMVELNVTSRQNLKNCSTPFDGRNNFQKAMRFADENLKKELQGYIDFIINRNLTNAYNDAVRAMKSANTEEAYKKAFAEFNELHDFKDSKELAKECLDKAEEARLTVSYNTAMSAMNSANTEQQYKSAAGKFSAIKTFRDAEEKAKLCLEKAEISRKDAIYNSAVSSMREGTISAYIKAYGAFKTIEEWKDSSTKIYDCERSIYEIEQKKKADRIEAARLAEEKRLEEERIAEEKRIEAERLAEEKRIADAKAAKKRKIIIGITTPIVCAIIAFVIVLNAVIIPNNKYNDAIALMDAGKYTEAISAFEALDGYKDSATKITECNTAILDGKYNDAIALMDAGKYTEAIVVFETIISYRDSADKVNQCQYNEATALMDAGKYTEAIVVFETIITYKDSADKVNQCQYNEATALMGAGKYTEAKTAFKALDKYADSSDKVEECNIHIFGEEAWNQLKSVSVGETCKFGAYEQDNDRSNGAEDIEWLVLEKEGSRILVISKYALTARSYHTEDDEVTWYWCNLREWLNNTYIKLLFSADIRAMIPVVTVSADENPAYKYSFTDPGRDTEDQLFLLSIDEAKKYFKSDSARECMGTEYAIENNLWTSGSNCQWWLRTPGKNQDEAAYVTSSGRIIEAGRAVCEEIRIVVDGYYKSLNNVGVRPALWIDLNA